MKKLRWLRLSLLVAGTSAVLVGCTQSYLLGKAGMIEVSTDESPLEIVLDLALIPFGLFAVTVALDPQRYNRLAIAFVALLLLGISESIYLLLMPFPSFLFRILPGIITFVGIVLAMLLLIGYDRPQ